MIGRIGGGSVGATYKPSPPKAAPVPVTQVRAAQVYRSPGRPAAFPAHSAPARSTSAPSTRLAAAVAPRSTSARSGGQRGQSSAHDKLVAALVDAAASGNVYDLPYGRSLVNTAIYELAHSVMAQPDLWLQPDAFRIPQYSPQGGTAYYPGSMSKQYDTLPPKSGTSIKGAGEQFGDSYVRPIPLVNTNRPLAERQRIWGFGAHGLPGRQTPPGLAAGRRRLNFRD